LEFGVRLKINGFSDTFPAFLACSYELTAVETPARLWLAASSGASRRRHGEDMARKQLEGVRVLDLSRDQAVLLQIETKKTWTISRM